MIALALLALASSYATAESATLQGRYQSVTETEYSITLTLDAKGRAQFEFVSWEADAPSSEIRKKLSGTWIRSGNLLTMRFASGQSATYSIVPCLSYREFGQAGCSMGLSLIKTSLADNYGLKRFGLWNTAVLRTDGQPGHSQE